MAVSEYGEIGRLVQYSPSLDMVILWAVYEVKEIDSKPVYRTSRGWVRGKPEQYFSPASRERSLTACIRRASKYAHENYPDKRAETH